ncbi:MAG TPA: hypothetical protein VL947_10850, partial [Cytophagales bacterium]|nr:hypothetical protein [Cytophagales bacterium]
MACFSLLTALSAQPLGKTPSFLKDTKPNFFKMQRKAERHFKKRADADHLRTQSGLTEDTEDSLGFGSGYNREEDNEYTRFKRWEWFWRDRINPDGSFPDARAIHVVYNQLQNRGKNLRTDATNPTWVDVSMYRNSGGYWGLGRTESVAINPKNSLEYYTTSDGGGIWKTIDGGKTY